MSPRLLPCGAAMAAALALSAALAAGYPEMKWTWALFRASCFALLIFGAGLAVGKLASSLLLARGERIDREATLAIASAAVWLLPLAVYWSRPSAVTTFAATIFSGMTVFAAIASAAQNPVGPTLPRFVYALAAGLLLEAAAVATGLERWRLSAAGAAGLMMLLGWMLYIAFGAPRNRGTGPLWHVAAAALLTSTAWLEKGGSGPFTGRVLAAVFTPPVDRPGSSEGTTVEDAHQTVVLWPDETETVTLIAPRSLQPIPSQGAIREQVIPFHGAYLLYRGRTPSKTPTVMHGDPALQSFRNQGSRPLSMDAVQHLGQHLDASLYTAIGVAIRNADKRPATVEIEVLIRDTAIAGPLQSIGRRVPSLSGGEEMLRFPLNGAARHMRFDEITVRFHLRHPRADRSAMIAIRHFALLR